MKYLIILDGIFSLLACFQLFRALAKSHVLEAKLNANSDKLEQRGLIYLLAEDKILLQLLARIIMWLLIIANFFLFTWSLSRMFNNFAPYATGWITYTAVIFHFIMFLIAHFMWMIYNGSNLSFFKIFKKMQPI